MLIITMLSYLNHVCDFVQQYPKGLEMIRDEYILAIRIGNIDRTPTYSWSISPEGIPIISYPIA